MCCNPWGHKESDTTEQLNWFFFIKCHLLEDGSGWLWTEPLSSREERRWSVRSLLLLRFGRCHYSRQTQNKEEWERGMPQQGPSVKPQVAWQPPKLGPSATDISVTLHHYLLVTNFSILWPEFFQKGYISPLSCGEHEPEELGHHEVTVTLEFSNTPHLRVFKGQQAFPVDLQQQVDPYPKQYAKLCWIKCWWNRHRQEEAEKHCHASAIWSSSPLPAGENSEDCSRGMSLLQPLVAMKTQPYPQWRRFVWTRQYTTSRLLGHWYIQQCNREELCRDELSIVAICRLCSNLPWHEPNLPCRLHAAKSF